MGVGKGEGIVGSCQLSFDHFIIKLGFVVVFFDCDTKDEEDVVKRSMELIDF